MHRFIVLIVVLTLTTPVWAQTQSLVTISSRGQSINAIRVSSTGTPIGAVILLAGDNGRLDLTADPAAEGGFAIGRLANNQLVRTRVHYAEAGFETLVPDLAPDLKVGDTGVVANYRIGQPHATTLERWRPI